MDKYLGFTPGDHDVRVHADRWVYYVRAVKRGVPLAGTGSNDGEGTLWLLPFALVFGKQLQAWQAGRPWKVGVVRMPADRWGNTAQGRVVHKERHPAGPVPVARLGELAEEVRRGRFAPIKS
jgi:hypothetical protein